ncbi:MAG: aldehyde ferredoxin oxidoreductase C-terminal domain-containing protein [Deltaproteobacteria bacterium]|nr:aldehyde ferredoxin oxidoreductase C-terminal domain-containing protein [Deltaproteobacteria bacterium]
MDLGEYQRRYFQGHEACFACPVSCGRYTSLPRGSSGGGHFGGLHVEGVLALGPGIGLFRWEPLLELAQACLLAGLDPASTGGVIGWAMDCRQAGLLTSQEIGPLTLERGAGQAALELTQRIVSGQGWGDQLGQGALRAARELGQEAEERVKHVKGLEMVGPDPCLAPASGLSLAISPGEWDPLKFISGLEYQPLKGRQGEPGPPYGPATDLADQVESVTRSEEERVSAESLGLCPFPNAYFQALGLPELSEQFTGLTGVGLDEARLRRIVARILTLERLLAGRDGCGRREDAPAERYFQEEAEGGPCQGAGLERAGWEAALTRYYQVRGWDLPTGLPSREAVADLDLEAAEEEAQGAIEAYQRRP